MRIILASLFVAGLVGCAEPPPPPRPVVVVQPPPRAPSLPPATAPICGKPAEKTAFAVTGLKTQLVVLALSCDSGEGYNSFVLKFRPELLAQQKVLDGFFSRAYGRRAADQQNDYVTALANNTSRTGLAMGVEFCQRNATLFSEVLALKTGPEMSAYAASKSFDQPLDVPDCANQSAPAAPATKKPVKP